MALPSPHSSVPSPPAMTASLHGHLPHTVALRGAKSGRMEDFLDLADPSNPNSEVDFTKIEAKRLEHERQRHEQMHVFEMQMRALRERHEEELEQLTRAKSREGPAPFSAPASPPLHPDTDQESHSNRSRSGEEAHQTTPRSSSTYLGRSKPDDSKSLPNSRRHSGEGLAAAVSQMRNFSLSPAHANGNVDDLSQKLHAHQKHHASSANTHVTTKSHTGEPALLNSFLLDEDLDANLSLAYSGKYLQMNTDDDKFPILVRHGNYPGMLSASSAMSTASAALDLAPLSQTPPTRAHDNNRPASEWPDVRNSEWGSSSASAVMHSTSDLDRSRSLSSQATASDHHPLTSPRQLSTSRAGVATNGSSTPTDRVSPRLDLSNSATRHVSGTRSSPGESRRRSGLPKGFSSTGELASLSTGAVYEAPPYVTSEGYGDSPLPTPASQSGFPPQYNSIPKPPGSADNYGEFVVQPYNMKAAGGNIYGPLKTRREPEVNKFSGLRLEDLQGDLYALCKDQHGCRFLQKKLEEGNPENTRMIYNEIFPHFGELMTDAFGNYLAQKLFEASNDEQRDALIESLSSDLVTISLNVHGTRAVQKIIDLLSTTRQVQNLILALNLNVVTLIKDLNGNHVVQKCLNHLPPKDNQFVYNAVCANCVEVATHRHGCCVVQRSIDHASEPQRVQLVTEITYNTLTLVQDAFGNYVVQYVLDLGDARFIDAIVRQFQGNICALSAQKFSSNVVEKCIRVSDVNGRRAIIDEILDQGRIERLVRDSFANYVVQCALDYAEPAQRAMLVASIRPVLPMIRNTPYGKRIQSKIQRDHDGARNRVYHPATMTSHFSNYPNHPSHFPAPHPAPPHPAAAAAAGIRNAPEPYMGNGQHRPPPAAASPYFAQTPMQSPAPPGQGLGPFQPQAPFGIPTPNVDFQNPMPPNMSGQSSPFS